MLERTLAIEPDQRHLVDAICDSETVSAMELPAPAAKERNAPKLA